MNPTKSKGNQVKRRNQLFVAMLIAGITTMTVQAAWAQTDHSTHYDAAQPAVAEKQTVPPTEDHANMPGMDHSAPAPASEKSGSGQPGGSASQDSQPSASAQMDHGNMQMQGGSAPLDARDPHAYSGGYVLGVGKYALGEQRQLYMADEHNFGSVLVDKLERIDGKDGNSTAYDMQAWFGHDYDRLVIKAEGNVAKGKLQDARTELLWGHAIASYWDTQLGLRYDSGNGPNRTWLAFGIQGLAPHWFDVDATAYVGESGRTALRLKAEYDVLLTQKLILQPSTEWSFYGKADPEKSLGSGLTDASAGVRLRYEFSRQFAPYVGIQWSHKFGSTASMARTAGELARDTRWVAGVRFWF